MITKEQYIEILTLVQQYIAKYKEIFPNRPMSNDFCAGIEQVVDLIGSLVKKE